jgi:hypothetical protein
MATVTDDFNRAVGPLGTAPTGQVWSSFGGIAQTINASGQAATGGGSSNAGSIISCGAADATYQVTQVNSDTQPGGIFFRWIDASNFWAFQNIGGTQLTLRKTIAGVDTDNFVPYTTFAPNDVFTVICSGNSIIAKINGVTKYTVTDAQHNTGTTGGMLGRSSTVYDNFSITLPGGNPPTIPASSGKYVYVVRRWWRRYRYNHSHTY